MVDKQPRKPGSLISLSDIAKLLGVSKQRAAQLVERESFPPPEDRPSAGPVWRAEDVKRWIARNR